MENLQSKMYLEIIFIAKNKKGGNKNENQFKGTI